MKKEVTSDIQERLQELAGDQQLLFLTDYDDCIIGLANRFGSQPYVLYDTGKVIQKLVDDWIPFTEDDKKASHAEQQRIAEDDAWEFFDFNIQGAWCGDNTPGFVETL